MTTLVGQFLLAGTNLGVLPGAHNGTTGSLPVTVPAQIPFVGQVFALQALSSAPGFGRRYSSAEKGIVGTL
jgi:hypothetical protein